MRVTRNCRSWCAGGRHIGWAVALAASALVAADERGEALAPGHDMVGTLSCMSASCHGAKEPGNGAEGWSRHAYVHWLQGEGAYHDGRRGYDPRAALVKADADPHALAGQRMLEPRFQEVLRRASGKADGPIDPRMYARCAQCHDPLGAATLPVENTHAVAPTLARREREQPLDSSHGRGIGCESCHGGARRWIAVHYERDISREQLRELGMVDTKDLLVRAGQCAGCHVGSAERDMNHDMIAAGHPPLRFELASYESLLPRKHWDDGPRRIAEPDYEVRLWAAGRMAAAEAALELVEGRARRAADEIAFRGKAPWPEFAEGNCFACHQPVRGEVGKLPLASLFAEKRGVPPWQTWNVGLVSAAVDAKQADAALQRLRAAMERSLVPEAAEIAMLAAETKEKLHEVAVQVRTVGSRDVLRRLASLQRSGSWDEACQEVAALVAVQRSLRDRGAIDDNGQAIIRRRLERIAAALRFESNRSEWPQVFTETSELSIADVERELAAIREELARVAAKEATR